MPTPTSPWWRASASESQIPIVVFTYVNPLYRLGFEAFARRAKAAGVDGFLLVDVPVEEADEFLKVTRSLGLSLIFLVAPTTTPARLARVLEESSGFVYYISRTGITGEQAAFQADFETKLARIKAASTLPVVVGFGVSTPEHVRTVCALADGAVVGSALVRRTLEKKPFPELLAGVQGLRRAPHRAHQGGLGPRSRKGRLPPGDRTGRIMELSDWRSRIDSLNLELVRILSERARCALAIAELKKKKMLPVLDAARERQVLEAVIARNPGPLSDDAIRRIFEIIMAEHRGLEESV